MGSQAHQAKANPADLPLIGSAPSRGHSQGPVNPDAAAWILPLIGRAIDRVMSRKEAAYHMGIDQGQLSRQLAGDGHLSTLRLGALGREFWLALAEEVRTHYNLVTREELRAEAEQHMELARRLYARAAGF